METAVRNGDELEAILLRMAFAADDEKLAKVDNGATFIAVLYSRCAVLHAIYPSNPLIKPDHVHRFLMARWCKCSSTSKLMMNA